MDVMGWTPEREAAFAEHAAAGFVPGRVVSQERDVVHAMTASGLTDVHVQRGFRRSASGTASFPTVGDWIALEPLASGLPRHVSAGANAEALTASGKG